MLLPVFFSAQQTPSLMGLFLKESFCPLRSKLFPLKSNPLQKGAILTEFHPLKVYLFP